MPRVQVYLPDMLYKELKSRNLPASELLQEALRAEIRRLELTEAGDDYIAALEREIGTPSKAERARAEAIARRIAARDDEQAS